MTKIKINGLWKKSVLTNFLWKLRNVIGRSKMSQRTFEKIKSIGMIILVLKIDAVLKKK